MTEPTTSAPPAGAAGAPGQPDLAGMVSIPAGTFMMGSDKHYPEEAPVHPVSVGAFHIDRHAVTNFEFRRFVDATGHVTSAERPADPAQYPGAKPELLAPSSVVFRKSDAALRERLRYVHYSLRIEEAYVYWVRHFVRLDGDAAFPSTCASWWRHTWP